MTSPRVLHCIPSLGGGGAEKQLTILAPVLPAYGWAVDVAVLGRGVHFDRLQQSGVRLHEIRSASPYDPMIPLRLSAVMRRVRADIVQTWLPQMDIAAGIAAWIHGFPWIVSERGSRPLPPSIKRSVRNAVTARATAVISNSETALEPWRARLRAPSLFHVPNAVSLPEIEGTAGVDLARYRVTPRSRVILTVGRLVWEKNLGALVEAMSFVTNRVDAVALLCGIGPDRETLMQSIAARDLKERVLLPGFVSDAAGWMKAADVFVSVSHCEGRPNALMEAMACGTPLVVSDIPEHREILDARSAILVDRNDPRAIAEGILRVLADPAAAKARADAAKAVLSAWTPDSIAAEYARIYQQLRRN